MIHLYRHHRWYFVLAALFIVPGLIFLTLFGLKLSIDFLGGSLLELRLEEGTMPTQAEWSEWLASSELVSVQTSGSDQVILKLSYLTFEEKETLLTELAQASGATFEELRFESIGPTLSRELLYKTLVAIGLVALIITVYIWYRFHDWAFGLSVVLAMIQDALLVVIAFSLLGHFFQVEVDVLFVTAILTTLSFSVHDTVVLFDRIRELRARFPSKSFAELANEAALQTFVRSWNNSITIILMLLALFLLGGESLRWFSFALLLGAIVGTYSSPFTSVPLLIEWYEWQTRRKRR